MLKVISEMPLRSPVVLCAVSGWSDAGFVASGALRYLVLKRMGHRIAEFDSDAIYAYSITRPATAFAAGKRVLQWPELVWHAIPMPELNHDIVVLVGPEPGIRWKECTELIADYAQRIGAVQVLTLGAFFAQVHYAGPPMLTGHSNDPETADRLRMLGFRQTSYEGPTGFVTAVTLEVEKKGIKSASMWAATPGYLTNTANPKLSAALLNAVEKLIGQRLDLDELEQAGYEMERRVDEILKTRPDLQTYIKKLESTIEPVPEQENLEEEPLPELPSAADVLKDLEDHLRRLREKRDDDQESTDKND